MDFNKLLEANNVNRKDIPNIDGLLRTPKILLSIKDINTDKPEQIFNLLMDSVIRRGDGLIFANVQVELKKQISEFVSNNEPVQFVFQGFPFKCHNPIETLRRTPDLGELATLQRLVDINETIKQIYPIGMKFVVLTESKTYQDLFGASTNEVLIYQNKLSNFAKIIGAGDLITFIDLMDLVKDQDEFFEKCKEEEKSIREEEIKQFIPVMMRSMPIIEEVAFEDLLAVFGYDENFSNLTNFEKDFSLYIQEGAKDLAIKYVAIQKVKKKFNLIGFNFPNAIYVSTTSKQDRYSFLPIHKKTRLYAHHGVPVLGSDKVDIVYLGEILTNSDIYTAVYVSDDIENAPFYFLKGKQHIRK